MSGFFTSVLNMSVIASATAVAVLVIRFFLKKAPKIFSYILWLSVLFRMVCPFSFESSISLMPQSTKVIPPIVNAMNTPAPYIGTENVNTSVSQYAQATMPQFVPPTATVSSPSFMDIASIIYFMGILVLICYMAISIYKMKQTISTATRIEGNIFETDKIKSPFVLGFIRPKIYLPTNLEKQEYSYILLHEQTHIKRLDTIIKPLAFLALSLHWFNPILWLCFSLMTKDMEMSCDENVLRHTTDDIRSSYSSSLLTLALQQNGIMSPLAFGESNVKQRIKNILNFKKPALWVTFATVSVLVIVSITFISNPKVFSGYSFTGQNYYGDGTHLFLAESRPHTLPEETAYNYFLYDVQNDIDKKYSLLPDTEQNRSDKESVKQNKSSHYNRHEELYTNYVLQAISTVDKNKIDQLGFPSSKYEGEENDPKYKYYNLNKTVADLGLKEYEVINVVFTQKYSDKLFALGPQWSNGTFSQDMLVGKNSTDKDYKIYEMGALITYTNSIFPNDGMAFLTGNFTINISESNSGNKKSVTDLQQKYNTLVLLAGGKETSKTSVNDAPSVPNYLRIDIYFDSDDSSNDYYVYSENNKYYIEKAYSFIHEITKSDYEQLTGILAENSGSSSTLSSSANTSDISELDSFVEEKLQIILSSPKTSSNPQDYINAHKPEYQQIVAQGKSVLPYLFKPFEHGLNYDLRSQVIKYICVDIIGPTEKSPYPTSVPQIWYNTSEMRAEYVLPDYKYEGSDPLLKQTYDTLSGNNYMPNNGFKVYGVHVFGSYEEGNKVKVFFAQSEMSYILCGTSLLDKSGGSGTAIFTYTKNADGSYTLDPPQDNGDYDHNLDNLCTMPVSGKKIEHLADQIKSYDFKEVINLQQQNLIDHLKKYGHTGVTYYTTNGQSVQLT